MTSLMTSQRPDALSVRINNFAKVDDHRVKKISSIGQKLWEKKYFENGQTDRQIDRQTRLTNQPAVRFPSTQL